MPSPSHPASPSPRTERGFQRTLLAALLLALGAAPAAHAFCGFYVAKADANLWNKASQVAIVRDGERTVMTMSNDYQGDLKEFALVVPVPAVLSRDQIHVGERKLIERLDAFSAPRLVEYFDPDPCARVYAQKMGNARMEMAAAPSAASEARARSLGVTIEARYTVGEYDILILSAAQSNGLETWLVESGYKLPAGASRALAPYIRQGLKFFVAKVNLAEQAKTGFGYLRPLQMAYESPRFMLPIRLGMLNARGAQDLLIYLLTRNGRVETSNYRTVKVPSDVEIPTWVKSEFRDFYVDMFEASWKREGMNAVFLEYFWDMGWCDPCAADPLTPEELRQIGVFWLDGGPRPMPQGGGGGAGAGGAVVRPMPMPVPPQPVNNVLLTRLHVRYDAEHFPEDLTFQETRDRQNFQGRYILRHAFTGELRCPEAREYRRQVRERQEKEATTLAHLTGWPMDRIRGRAERLPGDGGNGGDGGSTEATPAATATPSDAWWNRIWK
jgi:hypothetical protein